MRNFIATLMVSQGVPMLRGGDELSHSQNGNNNAYCQDNDLSWNDWNLTPEREAFLEFVCRAIWMWREHPVLQRRKFFQGRPIRGESVKDIAWLTPQGTEMGDADWAGFVRCLGVRVEGEMANEVDEKGRPIVGKTLLIMLNAGDGAVPFILPAHQPHEYWRPLLDTAVDKITVRWKIAGQPYDLQPRSVAVLQLNQVRPEFMARFWQWLHRDE
jgi:glycogen operon protein